MQKSCSFVFLSVLLCHLSRGTASDGHPFWFLTSAFSFFKDHGISRSSSLRIPHSSLIPPFPTLSCARGIQSYLCSDCAAFLTIRHSSFPSCARGIQKEKSAGSVCNCRQPTQEFQGQRPGTFVKRFSNVFLRRLFIRFCLNVEAVRRRRSVGFFPIDTEDRAVVRCRA